MAITQTKTETHAQDGIKELSTHAKRKDRRLNDDWLEQLLEDWGVWINDPIPELYTPHKISINSFTEKAINRATKTWIKCVSTRVARSQTPNYMPHHRMDRINRIIQDLPPKYYDFLKARYERGYTWQDMKKDINMSASTYYDTLRDAKILIKQRVKRY